MNLVRLTICRNSDWTLYASVAASMNWCDAAVILDHASTDETPAVINRLANDYPGRIHSRRIDDPVWREASHRQTTLDMAREINASHCAIVDDDEYLTANLYGSIRDTINGLQPGQVGLAPWLHCWKSLDRIRIDGKWGGLGISMCFRDSPNLHWTTRDGYDHHHREPFGSESTRIIGGWRQGGLLHIQHANWKRLLAKQAWYQAMELIRWPKFGAEAIRERYGPTVDRSDGELEEFPAGWWDVQRANIALDREPWQLADLRRMVNERGRNHFDGLDFFGVLDQ